MTKILAFSVLALGGSTLVGMQMPSKPLPKFTAIPFEERELAESPNTADVLNSSFEQLRTHESARDSHVAALKEAMAKHSVADMLVALEKDGRSMEVSQQHVVRYADNLDKFACRLPRDTAKIAFIVKLGITHASYQTELAEHLVDASQLYKKDTFFAREQAMQEAFRIINNINKNRFLLRLRLGISATDEREDKGAADIIGLAAYLAADKRYITLQTQILKWLQTPEPQGSGPLHKS